MEREETGYRFEFDATARALLRCLGMTRKTLCRGSVVVALSAMLRHLNQDVYIYRIS